MQPITKESALSPLGSPVSTWRDSAAPREFTLHDLLALLARRRGVVLLSAGVCIALAAILFAFATRMYAGEAEIQVQREAADALSLNSMMGQEATSSDPTEAVVTLSTEAQILHSQSLALSVIKALNLEHTPDFRAHFSPVGWLLGLFAPAGMPDPKNVPLEDAPARRSHVLKVFASNLKIKPVAGTRLIRVQYYSTNPRTAAAVVNLLVQDLVDFNFTVRQDATRQASAWLSGQLTDLRRRSQDLQAQVVELQKGSGVFTTGQSDKDGKDQVYTPALDRLQQATTQLAEAQSARIMKGALYQVVKDGDPELISGLVGNSMMGGQTSGISGSLNLLQSLRAQQAQTQAQLNELSAKFGPSYTRLAEVQANLDATNTAIRQESERIAGRVKNDYAVAQQVESHALAVFDQEKAAAQAMNDKAADYEMVRQEAAQSRNLYENMLARVQEANLVAGLHPSNITPVDLARPPARPAKPNILLYGAGGTAIGMTLGICLALFCEALDARIQTLAELETLHAPIALLPYHLLPRKRIAGPGQSHSIRPSTLPLEISPTHAGNPWMVAASQPRSAYTEALRSLRTTLLQYQIDAQPPQVMLITSSVPGEGKSMLGVNLAIVFAQRSKRVLLVDGDLRTPVLHERLGIRRENGLADGLLREEGEGAAIVPVHIPVQGRLGFDVVPAGRAASYPTELLSSDEMAELLERWRTEYDHILIDGAPLLPVADSSVLARFADLTLVVARHNVTDRRSLERTCQLLQSHGIDRTVLVLNGVRASGSAQFTYYGYKTATYSEGQLHG